MRAQNAAVKPFNVSQIEGKIQEVRQLWEKFRVQIGTKSAGGTA